MRNTSITGEESRIITVIRTAAMMCIVLCHVVVWFPRIEFLGQLLNVGVEVFFIMSGYLYGHKDIKNVGSWYGKQILKILLPVYIYTGISVIILLCFGKLGSVEPLKAVLFLLDLRGFADAGVGNVAAGHLWFVSFILICYLITPLLQKVRDKMTIKKAALAVACLSLAEIPLIILFAPGAFIDKIPGVFIYILAYYIGAYWDKKITKRSYILLTAAMAAAMAGRFAMKHFAGSGAISKEVYEHIIVTYTHAVFGFWVFITLYMILNMSPKITEAVYPVCRVCDKYSYEVYICHYMFLRGVVSLEDMTSIKIVNVLLFAVFTVCFAFAVKQITDLILKKGAKKNISETRKQ